MRFTLAIITLTMLGCTVHSHSTYVEYGGGQREARQRRPHAATAPRAGTKSDTSRRRSAAADETPTTDARNPLPAPHEPATATDRHHRPATLGHARTGVPVSASGSDARDGGPQSDAHKPGASTEEPRHATRTPEQSAIETRRLQPESTPRAADRDKSTKQADHAPIAGATNPKESIARTNASRALDSDRRKHQPVRKVADSEARPAHETATVRADREATLSRRAEAPVAESKKRDHQPTVSTDAAYKKVLRDRGERLLEDPETAKLKEPDERVR